MKDDSTTPVTATTTTATWKKDGSVDGGGGGWKVRYKFWALAAILLLAFWSMFTGSVTLKWSAGNLNPLSDDFDSPIHDDLDVLELEEREKVVRHMWDIYTHSSAIRLPRFWLEAFEAAYEDLTSDDSGVRSAAVSEIAKISLRSVAIEPPPVQSASSRGRKFSKQAEKDKELVAATGTSQ